ncbi:hypothetical protein ACFRAQ_36270 [Nocardia sp. NPDC056611]|uniref:hypothetical protein n=1 Tax=Nocardia sp. NPDC056611 TaxID=3345877 RepID=UPI0036701874
MRALLGDAAFDIMVNSDLRDESATGPHFDVLRRKENRVRWLRALVEIRSGIETQNAYDNAALQAHPGRTSDGKPSKAYVEAKNEMGERKRARATVMAKVTARIAEARDLIGSDPLGVDTLGGLALLLAEIELKLRNGQADEARSKIAWVMQQIEGAAEVAA